MTIMRCTQCLNTCSSVAIKWATLITIRTETSTDVIKNPFLCSYKSGNENFFELVLSSKGVFSRGLKTKNLYHHPLKGGGDEIKHKIETSSTQILK